MTLKKISTLIYTLGLATGIIAIGKVVYQRYALPAGVCPIDSSRTLMWVSIGFIAAFFILDFVQKQRAKNQ